MQTIAIVAIGAGIVIAAGTAFVMDDPMGWFAPSCSGDPVPGVSKAASNFQLRLTLQDNTTDAGLARTCMFDASGTKIFDQTYEVGGETGWMWDVNLPDQPHGWIVEFQDARRNNLNALGWYLESSSCNEVVPEFLATKWGGLSMVDCVLPSKYIPPMPRQYAQETNVEMQSAMPWQFQADTGGAGAVVASVAAGGVIAGFALWRWRTRLTWIAAGLFTRIVKPRVLEHPVRNEVVQIVETEPGIQRAEIARRLELAPGQAIHHLRVLVQQNVLVEIPNGWGKHYFVCGRYSPTRARQLVALRREPLAKFVDIAAANPGLSLQRLASLSQQSKSVTSKAVRRLERAGLLRIERAGRGIRVYRSDVA